MKKFFYLSLLMLFFISCSKEDSQQTNEFSLTTKSEPEEGGFLTPEEGAFQVGDKVQMEAKPTEGYIFLHWKGDLSGRENPTNLVMDNDKNITAVFEEKTSVLKSQLRGRWNFDYLEASQKSNITKSQSVTDNNCRIFSIIFNPDDSFILSTGTGELRGSYSIESMTTVVLGDKGRLENIDIDAEKLSFSFNLYNHCNIRAEAKKDSTFSEGDCVSFLDCQDYTFWISQNNGQSEFLSFYNDLSEIWYRHLIIDTNRNCRISTTTNLNETGIVLIENNPSSLVYLHNKEEGEIKITYSVRDDGILEASYETTNDTYYKYFEPSSQEVVDAQVELSECISLEGDLIFNATNNSKGLALHGEHLYIAAIFDNTIYRLNWTEENPTPTPFLTIGMPSELEVYNNTLYILLTPNWGERKIVKVDLELPKLIVEEVLTLTNPYGLAAGNSKLYVNSGGNILELDLESNGSPARTLDISGTPLKVIENFLYISDSDGISRVDLTGNPLVKEIFLNNWARDISEKIGNSFYYIGSSGSFLHSYNFQTRSYSKVELKLNFDPMFSFATPWSIVGNENYLFVSAFEGGGVIRVKL